MITAEQRADLLAIAGPLKGAGVLDFVSAWYLKAAAYLISRHSREGGNPVTEATRCAFVSTNSITQGEQVGVLWGEMLRHGFHIFFAHRTFQWNNEAKGVAAVHCVIVGFSEASIAPRSEEHTSELQSLMRISYAVFCLKKKKTTKKPSL